MSAAERKQRQREKENEKGWTQCNVRVPKDDPEIRATIRAVAEAAIQSAELYPRIAAVVRDECLQDLVGAALDDSGLARLFEIVGRREDLKRLVRIAITNVALATAMSDLTDARDEVSSCMAAVIHEIRMSTAAGVPAELLSRASMGALSHPEPVARFVSVREKGGLRARFLCWIMRL